jgi:hypothetical protein
MRQPRKDRRRTQAGVTAYLFYVQTMVRLEPDAVVIDDADNRDRNVKPPRGNGGDAVKCAIGRSIEDIIAPYRRHSLRFVFGKNAGRKNAGRNGVQNKLPPLESSVAAHGVKPRGDLEWGLQPLQ